MLCEPLDSRQLRAFTVLAGNQSFTQTAKHLNLTQSAVSHAIKNLEKDIGCSLIDRVGKKAVLTQEGEKLLTSAHSILQEMSKVRGDLEKSGSIGQTHLRIATPDSVCQHLLPPVLREFKDSFPHCNVTLIPQNTPVILELLSQNQIDLAIALQPPEAEPFLFRPLFRDELKFVVSSRHPWAQQRKISTQDLRRQNFILYTKHSYTSRLIQSYFRQHIPDLPSTIEVGSFEAIIAFVKTGVGIGIAPEWILRQELENGTLTSLPLGRQKLRRSWGAIFRQNRGPSLTEDTFLGLCQLAAENLIS